MTILEAIGKRHSVRKYKEEAIPKEIVEKLEKEIAKINKEQNLNISLFINEKKSFWKLFISFWQI